MRNVLTIFEREIRSYFSSPIAWLLLFMFSMLFGYFFWNQLFLFVTYGMQSQGGRSQPLSVNEYVIRPLLMNVGVIGMFMIPLITMRLFAEEKRSGTIELLVTSPISDAEMAIGKWLAAVVLYASLLGVTALNFIFLFIYGNPDWKPLAIGYLGLLLQAGALLALGTFLSTLTRNQIVAGGITFCLCLLLYVLGFVSAYDSSTSAKVMQYLSISTHYESFAKGVLELKDFVFYISVIIFGLFLTTRSIESLRWRS